MNLIKVFIYYDDEHRFIVEQFQEIFEELQMSVWACKETNNFNCIDLKNIEKKLRLADYFLVLLNKKSHESDILSKLLGYSLKLHQQREDFRPYIVGIIYGDLPISCQSIILKSSTSNKSNEIYDFSKFKCLYLDYPLKINQLKDFAEKLYPRVTFITDPETEAELLESSFKCYEELFPDEVIRDAPEYIISCLYHQLYNKNYSGQKVYGVLHLMNHVISMADIVCYPEKHKCFGGYFGVKSSWRQNNRANWFLAQIFAKLKDIDPELQYIVFEAEVVDFNFLQEVSKQKTLTGGENEEKILENLRSLRRLILYQSLGALALLQSDGTPCPYWQPALEEPLDVVNEREFIIMIWLFDSTKQEQIKPIELLDFVYDQIYKDCNGKESVTPISGYETYIDQLKKRIIGQIKHKLCLGKIDISPSILQLLWRLKKEGQADKLAL